MSCTQRMTRSCDQCMFRRGKCSRKQSLCVYETKTTAGTCRTSFVYISDSYRAFDKWVLQLIFLFISSAFVYNSLMKIALSSYMQAEGAAGILESLVDKCVDKVEDARLLVMSTRYSSAFAQKLIGSMLVSQTIAPQMGECL